MGAVLPSIRNEDIEKSRTAFCSQLVHASLTRAGVDFHQEQHPSNQISPMKLYSLLKSASASDDSTVVNKKLNIKTAIQQSTHTNLDSHSAETRFLNDFIEAIKTKEWVLKGRFGGSKIRLDQGWGTKKIPKHAALMLKFINNARAAGLSETETLKAVQTVMAQEGSRTHSTRSKDTREFYKTWGENLATAFTSPPQSPRPALVLGQGLLGSAATPLRSGDTPTQSMGGQGSSF